MVGAPVAGVPVFGAPVAGCVWSCPSKAPLLVLGGTPTVIVAPCGPVPLSTVAEWVVVGWWPAGTGQRIRSDGAVWVPKVAAA